MFTRSMQWMAMTILAVGVALVGCERKEPPAQPRQQTAAHDHGHDHDHDHDHDHGPSHDAPTGTNVVDWPALHELDMFVHTAEMAIEGNQLAALEPLMVPLVEKAQAVTTNAPKNVKDPAKVSQLQADLKGLVDAVREVTTPEEKRDFAEAVKAITHGLMESAGVPHKH